MAINKILASISADTSLIEEKLNRLLEVFPKHFSDELLSMVSGLLDNVILVNGPAAVRAGSTLDIICVLDFDSATYDQIMTAAGAFKTDLTHK